MIAYVCPWWAVPFTIDPPFRRLLHDPAKIVGPYVEPGMTVLDVGCGVGWFSIPMAAMVGEQGRVLAVDLQPQMLDMLRRRAERADVADRIETHPCRRDTLAINTPVDFALIFAMLHEVPDRQRLLAEVHDLLTPGGKLLLAEPPLHVSKKKFAAELAAAESTGLTTIARPNLRWTQAALLQKHPV